MFVLDEEGKVYKTEKNVLETHLGKVKISKKENESNIGKMFYKIDPSLSDEIVLIKRGPQTMKPKDIGFILSFVGIKKNWTVLDAGAGSGVMSFYLANSAKKVYSYERDQRFVKIFRKNIESLGIKNIELVEKDIYEGISQKDLDMIFLDLPEPWKVNVEKSLKRGGFFVVYLPSVTQVSEFVNKSKLKTLKICEIIKRDWKVIDKIARPEHRMLGHTGFIVFQRNI